MAFWQVGEGLGRKREIKARDEELSRTRKVITAMRSSPRFSRITTALVDGDLPLYSRAPGDLDTIGIQPLLWGSAQEPRESLEFLRQRRRLTALSNSGGLFWAWIPATAPAIVRANIWGDDVPPAWGNPAGHTGAAPAHDLHGTRGGIPGPGLPGRRRPDAAGGRALLIEMAFLNEEIDLLSPSWPGAPTRSRTISRSTLRPPDLPPPGAPPGVRVRPQKEFGPKPELASAIAVERRGALLLLTDYAANAQYQPPRWPLVT